MIIWVKDENNRVYHDRNGVKQRYPIYREFWQPQEVVSETKQNWVLSSGREVSKSPEKRPRTIYAFTEQEVEDDVWVNSHRHKLIRELERADASTLKKVAELIGYKAD